MTKEEIIKLKEEAYEQYQHYRDIEDEMNFGYVRKNYIRKFIKFKDCGTEQFMYVYNIWHSKCDDSVMIEGYQFNSSFSEYIEDIWISWTFWRQNSYFKLRDFDDNGLNKDIQFITKDEFISEMKKMINQTLQHIDDNIDDFETWCLPDEVDMSLPDDELNKVLEKV